MGIKLLLLTLTLYLGFIFTQERTIKGIVTAADDNAPIPGVNVVIKGTSNGTVTDANGKYSIKVSTMRSTLVFSSIGYATKEVKVTDEKSVWNVKLESDNASLDEVVITGYSTQTYDKEAKSVNMSKAKTMPGGGLYAPAPIMNSIRAAEYNTEEYSIFEENVFHETKKDALTTFSIDVDRAAYTNIRRMLNNGQLPPKDAIRIEEMINYFDYSYEQPNGKDPVSFQTEISDSPWNEGLKLLHIGLQAKKMPADNLPASNLVFLIDVSGSMSDYNKLPLLKQGFKLLVDQLRPKDHVAIVVYAGAAGTVLPSTSGKEKNKIKEALENLQAGGSTAGGEGIKLAYKIAAENFINRGNNRVILATDGDFNIGTSSEADLKTLIETKRESGVYLSVLGFGMGNYKDNKMETLADKGNGNYAYIDDLQEARKEFVTEFGGTLFTVAKDVKLQLEFNPKYVKAYRLIGYENRKLNNEDFNDDKKDAGEMGSGHIVTAIYEIVPTGVESQYLGKVDPLKYQENKDLTPLSNSKEVLTIKLRYKLPDENTSKLIKEVVYDKHTTFDKTSDDFRLAASIAEFGLLLRQSRFKGFANYDHIISTAKSARGNDEEGYRAEFIKLVKMAQLLSGKELAHDN
ncbi:VWA domain-containing protein [Emticicia sp. BO119]|uniref:vWA domain-containing protein n=1 Tax=Emticicia sp. BO119 TaxID=2757768 RepID=UPI0015F0DCAD|nr:VWA domain-containing protein [Emticicia sp. BO119]MBA4851655.1 von Willebrand factor type A domain-containing protein [Emticicia sp. BO119]